MVTVGTDQDQLLSLARAELERAGFYDTFSDVVLEAAERSARRSLHELDDDIHDLTNLLWTSIDNEESRDLDQVELVEQLSDDKLRLLVGIADVDHFVPAGGVVDEYAYHNTVSVYTPVGVFAMLPPALSTDASSLLEDATRLAVIVEMVIDPAGNIGTKNVFRALVRNKAKLAYDQVALWMDQGGPLSPSGFPTHELEAQLKLQAVAANRLRGLRRRKGALRLETIEAEPVLVDGKVTDLRVKASNAARDIIESFMVAANTSIAEFLEERGVASLRRVVPEPERWPKIMELASRVGVHLPADPDPRALSDFLDMRRKADPEHYVDLSLAVMKLLGSGEYKVEAPGGEQNGHFGLAVNDYSHSTAPNRRYPDLVTQRLLKAVIAGDYCPYQIPALTEIAERSTRMESLAKRVERAVRKAAVARLLSSKVGAVYRGIVTGVNDRGTFVRVLDPPVEGRVVDGDVGLDVGDEITVRLLSTDTAHGFIDFAVIRKQPRSEH